MDIQALTERESGARYGAIGGPWNRNGSPSMSPNYSKYFSLAPPFLLLVRFIKTKEKKSPPYVSVGSGPGEANVILLCYQQRRANPIP